MDYLYSDPPNTASRSAHIGLAAQGRVAAAAADLAAAAHRPHILVLVQLRFELARHLLRQVELGILTIQQVLAAAGQKWGCVCRMATTAAAAAAAASAPNRPAGRAHGTYMSQWWAAMAGVGCVVPNVSSCPLYLTRAFHLPFCWLIPVKPCPDMFAYRLSWPGAQ